MTVIAHRGASARAPEGTRAAIQMAASAGAQMVELDVQMTQDRRLIVFHDARLERTTNGSGTVNTMRYGSLAQLDAGSWFHPRFASQRILLLSQALRLVPRRMRINLELKRTARRALVLARLRRCVARVGVRRRLLISSDDPALLRPLASTRLALALICRRSPDRALSRAIALRCRAWHPHYSLVTRLRVARAHAAGLRVHAWTVDALPRARHLVRCGVDGIFTNDPTRLASLLTRRSRA